VKRHILITGLPGCGKTTLVKKLASILGDKAGGFYTKEIRGPFGRQGFQIVTFDKKTGILAHQQHPSDYRVGKYGVNLADLEQIGVEAISQSVGHRPVIIIDEIGKMELFSSAFEREVRRALDSASMVIATIMLKSHPFADEIKARPDVRLVTLTFQNREKVAEELMGEMKANILSPLMGES